MVMFWFLFPLLVLEQLHIDGDYLNVCSLRGRLVVCDGLHDSLIMKFKIALFCQCGKVHFFFRDGFFGVGHCRELFYSKHFFSSLYLKFPLFFSPTLSSLQKGHCFFLTLFSLRNVASLDCDLEADTFLILLFVVSALIFEDFSQYFFLLRWSFQK